MLDNKMTVSHSIKSINESKLDIDKVTCVDKPNNIINLDDVRSTVASNKIVVSSTDLKDDDSNMVFTIHSGVAFKLDEPETVAAYERICKLESEIGEDSVAGLKNKRAYLFLKRAFDIAFSSVVLVCLSWLFAIIALIIKIDDPKGSVIFKQTRVGINGREFKMYKFRTMCMDAEKYLDELQELNEKTGPVFKINDDPPITRVGNWLRKISMASIIIGAPGERESTKALSCSTNSSLDLKLCECRPGFCSASSSRYKPSEFLSLVLSKGVSVLRKDFAEWLCFLLFLFRFERIIVGRAVIGGSCLSLRGSRVKAV